MTDASDTTAAAEPTFFVTGYPGFLGRRLVEHLVREAPRARVYLLVQARYLAEAEEAARALPEGARVELLEGDVVDLHLGLAGEEYQRLRERVTHVFHLAAVSSLTATREAAWRTNVDGTRNVLELARDCARLERLVHFSTCHVSGDRQGVIAEDELEQGQGFRNAYEETKYHAERLVQRAAGAGLPVTILRPGSVVGEAHAGDLGRLNSPYYLGLLLVTSPLLNPLPLPGNGEAPLHVVPADFVVRAAWALARDPRALGRTFHLVDPQPLSARRVYEQVAERAGKRVPRLHLPARAADAVLRLPLLERLARPQRSALSVINHLAFYNCQGALDLLEPQGIRCPPLPTYLDALVDSVRAQYRRRHERQEELAEDPLDEAPAKRRP